MIENGSLWREKESGSAFMASVISFKNGDEVVHARGLMRLWNGPVEKFTELFEPVEDDVAM